MCTLGPAPPGVQLTLGRWRSNYCLDHFLSWQREDSGGRIIQWLLSPCLEVARATSTHVPCTREVTWPEPSLVNGSSILQGPRRKGPDEGGKAGILTITQSIPVNNIAFYRWGHWKYELLIHLFQFHRGRCWNTNLGILSDSKGHAVRPYHLYEMHITFD